MIEHLQALAAPGDIAQRIGVQAGSHDLLAATRLGQPLGDGRHDHAVPKVIVVARVRPHSVGSDHIDVVVVSAGASGQMPDVKAAQQGRRPEDDLGPLDGQQARKLGEIAVVADDHAYAAQRGLEHIGPPAGGHPAAAIGALQGEGMRLVIEAHDLTIRPDEDRGVIDHAPLRAAPVGGPDDMDAQRPRRRLDVGRGVARHIAHHLPQFARLQAGDKAGRHRFGKDDQVRLILADRLFQPGHALFHIGPHVVGRDRDLHTGRYKLLHLPTLPSAPEEPSAARRPRPAAANPPGRRLPPGP